MIISPLFLAIIMVLAAVGGLVSLKEKDLEELACSESDPSIPSNSNLKKQQPLLLMIMMSPIEATEDSRRLH